MKRERLKRFRVALSVANRERERPAKIELQEIETWHYPGSAGCPLTLAVRNGDRETLLFGTAITFRAISTSLQIIPLLSILILFILSEELALRIR